ncbi:MAG: hypothetical protein J5J00_08020 [Deltaproteobacteria bacterium]|nr:hypothetical protein [Deltaproteobacteria bacterium]
MTFAAGLIGGALGAYLLPSFTQNAIRAHKLVLVDETDKVRALFEAENSGATISMLGDKDLLFILGTQGNKSTLVLGSESGHRVLITSEEKKSSILTGDKNQGPSIDLYASSDHSALRMSGGAKAPPLEFVTGVGESGSGIGGIYLKNIEKSDCVGLWYDDATTQQCGIEHAENLRQNKTADSRSGKALPESP